MQWLAVFVGGGLGSLLRHALGTWLNPPLGHGWPWGTWAVNAVGCLLAGFTLGWLESMRGVTPLWRIVLLTGFCGGFTTFSAFALEVWAYAPRSRMWPWYLGSTVVVSLLACGLGLWLARRLPA